MESRWGARRGSRTYYHAAPPRVGRCMSGAKPCTAALVGLMAWQYAKAYCDLPGFRHFAEKIMLRFCPSRGVKVTRCGRCRKAGGSVGAGWRGWSGHMKAFDNNSPWREFARKLGSGREHEHAAAACNIAEARRRRLALGISARAWFLLRCLCRRRYPCAAPEGSSFGVFWKAWCRWDGLVRTWMVGVLLWGMAGRSSDGFPCKVCWFCSGPTAEFFEVLGAVCVGNHYGRSGWGDDLAGLESRGSEW